MECLSKTVGHGGRHESTVVKWGFLNRLSISPKIGRTITPTRATPWQTLISFNYTIRQSILVPTKSYSYHIMRSTSVNYASFEVLINSSCMREPHSCPTRITSRHLFGESCPPGSSSEKVNVTSVMLPRIWRFITSLISIWELSFYSLKIWYVFVTSAMI